MNETDKLMLCFASYPSLYELETIHGIEQKIQVKRQESFTRILKVYEALNKTKR